MCWFRKKKNNEDALKLLHEYVTCFAEPQINVDLRSGLVTKEVETLDGLFEDNILPNILYRHVNIDSTMKIDDIIQDPAYISASKSFEAYYGKIYGQDLSCLRIHTKDTELKSIDVDKLLGEQGEEEVILPRNIKLRIISMKKYTSNDFNGLLNEMHCDHIMNAKTLIADNISSYTVYDVEVA